MGDDVVLFSVLNLSGKSLDVTLSSRTLSWVASASSRVSDTGVRKVETREVHHYHFVKLSEIIGVDTDIPETGDKSGQGTTIPHKLHNQDDFTFTVHCIRRNKQGKWRLRDLKFECMDEATRQSWVDKIQDGICKQGPVRPRSLLVFINPFGGKREAASIYRTHSAPLFKLARIKTAVIFTEAKNHARDVMLTKDLTAFDGVVCVGGDGTFAEVVNGLLVRTQQEGGVDHHDPEASPLCPKLRIGIIPAGSTDVIVCDTTGVNDPVTSTIQIILGCSLGLDVCSVHSGHQLLRYTISFMGYGFFGDVLKESENYRWLGPRRYDFSGFKKFFANQSYCGEVSFLVSADEDHHPQDKTKCRVGCVVCLRRSESQLSDLHECLDSNVEAIDLQEVKQEKEVWKKVTGNFCAINAALVSGCNRLSPTGIAPSSHLGNGCLDLLLVHKCSRINFLRHLNRLGSSGNHFNFDFVEVHRVKEFNFKSLPNCDEKSSGFQPEQSTSNTSLVKQPQARYRAAGDTSTSTWNMDGEIEDIADINMHVHCQLVKIFARGREDFGSMTATCCSSQSKRKNKSAWR
ncbi:ceramide kinase-like [Asterias amurensis]|uniref:ceramide kinase-like n=1 Tax=Asterias amurensis TaxID=7602 RepID=UPI003AB5794C